MEVSRASTQPLSVEEFLAFETRSDVKHEYLGGVIYAMAGASEAHNRIATNLLGLLHRKLRGLPARRLALI